MKVRRGFWVALAASVLLGWGIHWFFGNFQKVDQEFYVGFQGEARHNRHLAEARILTRMGLPAESMAHLPKTPVPQEINTLVFSANRTSISPAETETLLEWVAQGNSLIFTIRPWESGGAVTDPLLKRLKVGLSEMDGYVSSVELPYAIAPFDVDLYAQARLVDESGEAVLALADDDGPYLLQFNYGAGRVTVVTSLDFIDNNSIGTGDHSDFFWHLLHLGFLPKGVWLIYGEDMPALPVWLWRNAQPVVIAAAVLLLLWLWSISRRFGPVLAPPPEARRSLLEHIEAGGRFLWHHKGREQLLAAAQQALMQRVRLRHPGWSDLPTEELARRISDETGFPVTGLQQALASEHVAGHQDFTHKIQLLEAARKSL